MEIVEEYEKQLNDSLRDKIRENENTRDNLKRQIENLEQELKKHYSDADEKELNELQNKLADMPEMFERELFGSDMTTEVIAQALKRNGETFSIISSEGGIFGNFAGRYSKMVNVDLINSAYNGEAVRVFRMTRETVKLDHPLLTITQGSNRAHEQQRDARPGLCGQIPDGLAQIVRRKKSLGNRAGERVRESVL